MPEPIWDGRIIEEVFESVQKELSQPAEDGTQLEDTFPSPKVLPRKARTTTHGAGILVYTYYLHVCIYILYTCIHMHIIYMSYIDIYMCTYCT